MSVFETLNGLNVNEHTEKKKVDGKTELTYLSWPWAWAEVKKRYPDAHYEIKRGKNGLPYSCDPTTGYMVFTSVTIEGITHDMWLPVMDGANNAMKQSDYTYFVKNPNFKYAKRGDDGRYYDKYGNEQPEYFEKRVKAATMFDVNKAIMRCLVKNLAMFGLGLYIYAGEDLPEGEEPEQKPVEPVQNPATNRVVVTVKDAADAATEARIKCLKLLKETAAFAFGPEKADEAVDYYLGKWNQTRETMTGDVYKKVKEEITSIIAQNAKKEGAA